MAGQSNPELVDLLRNSRRIFIFTGAGISTSSGIPDYRGPQGVWKRRQPVYYNEFMSNDASRRDYWDFKLEGWEAYPDASPNRVHDCIAQLEAAGKIEGVVTQNIDGLHAKAGTSRSHLVEIHGTDHLVQCQTCGDTTDPESHLVTFRQTGEAPVCPCGGFLKQATISFGQMLNEEDLDRAARIADASDLAISLGSTLSVNPAASFPLLAARQGTPYVIINRGATSHDGLPGVTLRLDGDVGELFAPAVTEALA